MATVIDVECFFESNTNPVIKEITVCSGERIICQTFKPPRAWRCLPIHIRRKNAWITRHLNHFRWSDGELPYCELAEFLKANVSPDSTVYAKGRMKCDLLSSLLESRVHNLEDQNCPKVRDLPEVNESCPHTEVYPSHSDISSCTLKKCRAFAKWLRDGRSEDTVG